MPKLTTSDGQQRPILKVTGIKHIKKSADHVDTFIPSKRTIFETEISDDNDESEEYCGKKKKLVKKINARKQDQ